MRPIRMAGMGPDSGPHSEEHDWRENCNEWPQCREVSHVGSQGEIAVGYDPPPKHYEGDGIMPWNVIDAWGLDYYLGNIAKYICRAGKKDNNTRLDDLIKVRNFINRAIELEEKKDV